MIRRIAQLLFGLALYGFASALMLRSELGLSPWNVFHQGVANHTHLSFGTVVGLTGGVLLLFWIPLRQRVGLGTVANVLVIGTAADVTLAHLPEAHGLAPRLALLALGVTLTGVASGLYIGAGLEPGPRDGIMTGLVKRTGWSIRTTRTAVELAALAIGVVLGGKVGVGTVVYALAIGPLVHFFLPKFTWRAPAAREGNLPNATPATSGKIH